MASENANNETNAPISGMDIPRFAAMPTFMRLPHVGDASQWQALDIGILGVPWDGGTTNRPGARHGPRQLRDFSSLIRQYHPGHQLEPFKLAKVADLGDVGTNPINLMRAINTIEEFVASVLDASVVPLTAGGDHTISYPILKAVGKKQPVGMVHFDAHSDTNDSYFGGEKITHGTPFRRAIEDGVLDPKRVIQIGIRGSRYDDAELSWARANGVRIIEIEEYWELGDEGCIAEAHRVCGDGPTYLSFDIDCLDPAFAPGTGTPEIGGFTPDACQRMLRGLKGIDFVGGDMVEVSPPFDPAGLTAIMGVNMMWEILCLLVLSLEARRGSA